MFFDIKCLHLFLFYLFNLDVYVKHLPLVYIIVMIKMFSIICQLQTTCFCSSKRELGNVCIALSEYSRMKMLCRKYYF